MRIAYDHYEIVDQKIIQYLKEGKNTLEIMSLLNQEGFKTARGDIFLRKTVNNRITKMREMKIDLPPLNDIIRNPKQLENIERKSMKKKVKLDLIKPHIYKTVNGKFRIRKLIGKTMFTKTCNTLQEAEEYLVTLISSQDVAAINKVSTIAPKKIKREYKNKFEHKMFEIADSPTEEKKFDDSVTIIIVPNFETALNLLKERN